MEVKYDLTEEDKSVLQSQWEATVLAQAPDIFMEAMLQSIKDSPKLLEVISCRMHDPSIQSLTEWPKLLNMIKGNGSFFSRQIETNRLEESLVRHDAEALGARHIHFTPYGFKPQFLDIWQANMIRIIARLNFPTAEDRTKFVAAFSKLASFLCTIMVIQYEHHMQSVRYEDRQTGNYQTPHFLKVDSTGTRSPSP
ncbi:hypothetical protein AAVH_07141 [Aphelenchoides avenae]|nr:hypothetical protein AAVH_07141 [Aphelenchus avenae]